MSSNQDLLPHTQSPCPAVVLPASLWIETNEAFTALWIFASRSHEFHQVLHQGYGVITPGSVGSHGNTLRYAPLTLI